jgi:K+-sensing histidine kinase KdpD
MRGPGRRPGVAGRLAAWMDGGGSVGRTHLSGGRAGRFDLGGRLGRPGSWLFWAATLLAVTVALVSVRGELDQAHVTLIYLLVVLGGSASGGRALGFTLACACFLLIDYFLQTPYDTLSVDKPLDWLVLLAFLVTATVATQLLGRANAEAAAARRRAEEIDRLAALGAETLSAGRADDALAAIAAVIRETTGAAECQIYVSRRPQAAAGVDGVSDQDGAGGRDGAGGQAGADGQDGANGRDGAGGQEGVGGRARQGGQERAGDQEGEGGQDRMRGDGFLLAADVAVPAGAAPDERGERRERGGGGRERGERPERGEPGERAILETVAWVAEHRRAATERLDGTPVLTSAAAGASAALDAALTPARALLLPLSAHDLSVGVLRLADRAGLRLDPARRRFLDALSYYAALGIERVQLAAEAEHAEALREADRLKDALLASVSHDLRTPLTTIKALAHDIAGGGDERAAVIEQQADRLNHMVADLLDLSRLNAGGLPVHTEINAAEDLVGAALQQVAGALGDRELRTALALKEPMPVGRFDFVHALRVLVNLIENALKYSPPNAPIDISMRGEGDLIAIAVADRGRGVAPAERERIFEPFYRPAGAAPDGARVGGAGLGLAIARRLAEAQGGTLTYGERPGGGSIFTLRLPAARLDAAEESLLAGRRD